MTTETQPITNAIILAELKALHADSMRLFSDLEARIIKLEQAAR